MTKEKEGIWKLENWEFLPRQDSDEENGFSESKEESTQSFPMNSRLSKKTSNVNKNL